MSPFDPLVSEPWMRDAACTQTDPDIWFPAQGDVIAAVHAKRICGACPVAATCREWAIDRPELQDGIFGGLSAKRRKIIRRERDAA